MPRAEKGVLDLSSWNFPDDGSVSLEGEWVFWWKEIRDPDDPFFSDPAVYVNVPDVWTNYEIDGQALSAEGYATYSLILIPPDELQTYGLYIEGEGSAFALWLNDRLLIRKGRVASDSHSRLRDKGPLTLYFESNGEPLRFLVQMSNDQHRKGGFRNSFLLGLVEPIHHYQLVNWFIEAFSLGVLFIMGLYHLIIYHFRRTGKAPLYFALLCFLAALRHGVTDQCILPTLFPLITWSGAIRMEYFVFYISPAVFVLFFKNLFPDDINKWFARVVIGISLVFSTLVFIFNTMILSHTVTFYQVVWNIEIPYYIYFIIRIARKKRAGSSYFALATLIFFSTVVIETLVINKISDPIRINYLYPLEMITSFGFLAYIFVQAIYLASRYSSAFARAESLAVKLRETNRDLEYSEKKYRTIFEESKDMIFITGVLSRVQDFNPVCTEILGYTREELLSLFMKDILAESDDFYRLKNKIMEQGYIKNLETILLSKSGRPVNVLVNVVQRKGEDGQLRSFQWVAKDITAMKQAEAERLRAQEFEQMSITDPLTKIHNRRFFNEAIKKEEARTRRIFKPLSVIIFDIDNFKTVNDTFGHFIGDQVLQKLAALCRDTMRDSDLFARFGGEEFIILTPETDSHTAMDIAERLRAVVNETIMARCNEGDILISISLGVASWNPAESPDISAVLDRADRALYDAKNTGRNKAVLWEDLGNKGMVIKGRRINFIETESAL